MRPTVVFLLVLVFGAVPTHAEWTWLHPQPQGHALYDVEFLDDDTAIAVGDVGTVLVTHDTGLTWSVSVKTNGIAGALRKVARLDEWTAITVGDGGTMLKTTDAGATWWPLTSGTTANFEDVDFSGQLGMAVGGGMIRSTDGGQTWAPITADCSALFAGVDVVTAWFAVAVGPCGFYRSMDAGQTWSESSSIGDDGSRVSFSDSLHGAASFMTAVYTTSDAGQTWKWRPLDTGWGDQETEATDFEMMDPQTILLSTSTTHYDPSGAYSSFGNLFQSTNNGRSWHVEEAYRVLRGIAVNSQGHALLVGDGGVVHRWMPPSTWEQTGGWPYSGEWANPGRVAFRSASVGMAVAGDTWDPYYRESTCSVIIRTFDSGGNWAVSTYGWSDSRKINDVTYPPGSLIAYAAAQTAAPSSGGGPLVTSRVTKSTDDGATWTDIWASSTTPAVVGIDFSSPTHGVAVGGSGTFVVIDHDVVTPGVIPDGGTLQGVAFADALVAVAVGTGGVFRSEDSGTSWNPVTAPTGARNATDFASPSVGVAVGNAGVMIRTDDGGLTWNTVSVPTTQNLYAVSFATASYGLVVGNGGTVLETTNAGLTWSTIESPTAMALTDVICLSPGHAVVVGPDLNVFGCGHAPVSTLIASFEAAAEPFAALLRWTVGEDANLSYFVIRRRDGVGTIERTIASSIPAASRTFRDRDLVPGQAYEYRLLAVDLDGSTTASAPLSVTIPGAVMQLLPNHPNPFNPSTTIRFVIPERARVRLAVYDIAGRHVVTLLDDIRDAGVHSVQWNGLDAEGGAVASGVYVSRLDAGARRAARKMVLLRQGNGWGLRVSRP